MLYFIILLFHCYHIVWNFETLITFSVIRYIALILAFQRTWWSNVANPFHIWGISAHTISLSGKKQLYGSMCVCHVLCYIFFHLELYNLFQMQMIYNDFIFLYTCKILFHSIRCLLFNTNEICWIKWTWTLMFCNN